MLPWPSDVAGRNAARKPQRAEVETVDERIHTADERLDLTTIGPSISIYVTGPLRSGV